MLYFLFVLLLVFVIGSGLASIFTQKRLRWILLLFSVLSAMGAYFTFATFEQPTPVDKKIPAPKIEQPQSEEPQETTPEEEQKPSPQEPTIAEPAPNEPEPAAPILTTPPRIMIPANEVINYQVVKGDTLSSIALRSDITVEKIKQWNNLTSDTIYTGQILKLYGTEVEPAIPAPRATPVMPTPPPPPVLEKPETPSQLITHGSLQQPKIALTFDAGSDTAGIQILDILKKHQVKATFFLTGKWAEKFPDYTKRIAMEGHVIGNHTYSHPDPVTITSASLLQEIQKAEQAIKLASGKSPQPYFRFPYGSYNSTTLLTVGQVGYHSSIQWSLDTIDWQQPAIDVIVSRIKAGASNGDIVLMHIGGINTPAAVDQVIPYLKAKGFQLVTISELLK